MNSTFEGYRCPWNPNCGDGTIVIGGYHPDEEPQRVTVLPSAGHPWICFVKDAVEKQKSKS